MKLHISLNPETLERCNSRVLKVDWQQEFFKALCQGNVEVEIEEPSVKYVLDVGRNIKGREG